MDSGIFTHPFFNPPLSILASFQKDAGRTPGQAAGPEGRYGFLSRGRLSFAPRYDPRPYYIISCYIMLYYTTACHNTI